MLANYGYADGLGEFYLAVDTNQCNGCGECVTACPKEILEIYLDDYDENVMKVKDGPSKQLYYLCGSCTPPGSEVKYICEQVCEQNAISHSW